MQREKHGEKEGQGDKSVERELDDLLNKIYERGLMSDGRQRLWKRKKQR